MRKQDVAFVYFSLKTLSSFSVQHRLLIEQAAKDTGKSLRIVVSCPLLSSYRNSIDSLWHPLQELLSLIYVAQLKPSYELGNPLLDARVVFLELCGYEISLDESYQRIYVNDTDTFFVELLNQKRSLGPLPVQVVPINAEPDACGSPAEDPINPNPQQFAQVAVGGTFDHIHAGHKILLTMTALLASKRLACGVTDDQMLVRKKHRELIASTEQRIQNVLECLRVFRQDIEYDVMPMADAFGPTITEEQIEALVVSAETIAGAHAVNAERAKLGWAPLELRVINVISPSMTSVQGQDISALKISSTWIRNYIASQQQPTSTINL